MRVIVHRDLIWRAGPEIDRIDTAMQQPVFSATEKPVWNFEQEPFVDESPDETSYNLRAYMDRLPDEKVREYSSSWTDEQVMEWCGDFKDDGALMMACSERDVEIEEFRRVLEQAIAYRDRVRPTLASSRS